MTIKAIIKQFLPKAVLDFYKKEKIRWIVGIIKYSGFPFMCTKYLWKHLYGKAEYELFLRIINYCDNSKQEDLLKYSKYLKINGLSVWLDDFCEKYKAESIPVFQTKSGWYYVEHRGKKLFGKKKWTAEELRDYYNSLLIEQDDASPHKYLKGERLPRKDDVVVADVGAAEGIFSLGIIDLVKKIYLFECDKEWIEPLCKTFEPYKDKVVIVEKFVGANTGDKSIALDDFFHDKNIDYLKADIEGAERHLLKGARGLLRNKIKQILLCAYHRNDDEKIIISELNSSGFLIDKNRGKMLIYYDDEISAPFFRVGVIYGEKNV